MKKESRREEKVQKNGKNKRKKGRGQKKTREKREDS